MTRNSRINMTLRAKSAAVQMQTRCCPNSHGINEWCITLEAVGSFPVHLVQEAVEWNAENKSLQNLSTRQFGSHVTPGMK